MRRQFFGMLLSAFFISSVEASPQYELKDLGNLGSTEIGEHTFANAINNSGQVTGGSYPAGVHAVHAFLYFGGDLQDLGTAGGFQSVGTAINEYGDVTGPSPAFLYSNGVMQNISTSAIGTFTDPRGINDLKQVVGSGAIGAASHAMLYSDGVVYDLGAFGQSQDINNAGQIVGAYGTPEGTGHGYLISDGVFHDLGTLGGMNSQANAINELGQIAGGSDVELGSTIVHAFLYTDGQMHDLGTLAGFEHAFGMGLNNNGQVVGYAERDAIGLSHAFVVRDGTMYDLNALVDPSLNWQMTYARGINDQGQIVGGGYVNGDYRRMHAFLLTPVPEPSTLALAALGAVGLLIVGSRPQRFNQPPCNLPRVLW